MKKEEGKNYEVWKEWKFSSIWEDGPKKSQYMMNNK